MVQRPDSTANPAVHRRHRTSRRLVPQTHLERWRFEGKPVVATRFVRSCPKGHVDDLNWRHFAHGGTRNVGSRSGSTRAASLVPSATSTYAAIAVGSGHSLTPFDGV